MGAGMRQTPTEGKSKYGGRRHPYYIMERQTMSSSGTYATSWNKSGRRPVGHTGLLSGVLLLLFPEASLFSDGLFVLRFFSDHDMTTLVRLR